MPTLFLLLKGVLKFIFESAILFRKKEKEHAWSKFFCLSKEKST